jgi:hypothetical protein
MKAPLAILAVLVAAPACLQQISTGTGTTDSSGGGGTASTAAPAGTTPVGGACGTDSQTGVTLCSQISTCPDITVDQSSLSGCGFKIHAGAVIDLECLCNGEALCPIGVADTCAEASALLANADLFSICSETAQSRCTAVGGEAGAAPVSTAQGSSTCDRLCESECAGSPDCIQLCGC